MFSKVLYPFRIFSVTDDQVPDVEYVFETF